MITATIYTTAFEGSPDKFFEKMKMVVNKYLPSYSIRNGARQVRIALENKKSYWVMFDGILVSKTKKTIENLLENMKREISTYSVVDSVKITYYLYAC